jgi:hypothetical protein
LHVLRGCQRGELFHPSTLLLNLFSIVLTHKGGKTLRAEDTVINNQELLKVIV